MIFIYYNIKYDPTFFNLKNKVMIRNMSGNRKVTGLVLAGLAAFAYYKYAKMSAEEKSNLANTIKEKGQRLWDQFIPGVKSAFAGENNAGV